MLSQLPDSIRRTMIALTEGLQKILSAKLIALYLGGSVAAGDFYEASSDLDFLAVTDGPLSPEDGLSIALLHRDLLRQFPLASRLEGDYAPLDLITPRGTALPVPGCEHGVFLPKVGEIMLSADNIANMRENGLAFHGRPPRQVLPSVTPEDVRAAARAMLLDGPGSCEAPAEMAVEVLNLTRSLCVLETGVPATRVQGGQWALSRLSPIWHPLIHAALRIRRGSGTAVDGELLTAQFPVMDRELRLPHCGPD